MRQTTRAAMVPAPAPALEESEDGDGDGVVSWSLLAWSEMVLAHEIVAVGCGCGRDAEDSCRRCGIALLQTFGRRCCY